MPQGETVATDEAIANLMVKHKEATADLKEFLEEPDFEEGDFIHKTDLKTRIAMIEENIAKLTEM